MDWEEMLYKIKFIYKANSCIYYVNNIKMIANDITLQSDIFVMQIDKLCSEKYKNTAPGNCLGKHNFHIMYISL